MRSDDRVMAILTVMILIIALATFVQRGDIAESIFGADDTVSVESDTFKVEPGRFVALDVLANDRGITPLDRETFLITEEPVCGVVRRSRGYIELRSTDACRGTVAVGYCVARDDQCVAGQVDVVFLPNTRKALPTEPARLDTTEPASPIVGVATTNAIAESQETPAPNTPTPDALARDPAPAPASPKTSPSVPKQSVAALDLNPPQITVPTVRTDVGALERTSRDAAPLAEESHAKPDSAAITTSPSDLAVPRTESGSEQEPVVAATDPPRQRLNTSFRWARPPTALAKPGSPDLPKTLPSAPNRPVAVTMQAPAPLGVSPTRPTLSDPESTTIARDAIRATAPKAQTPEVPGRTLPQIAAVTDQAPDALPVVTARPRPEPTNTPRSGIAMQPVPDTLPHVPRVPADSTPETPGVAPLRQPFRTTSPGLNAPKAPAKTSVVLADAPANPSTPSIRDTNSPVLSTIGDRLGEFSRTVASLLRPDRAPKPNVSFEPAEGRMVSVLRLKAQPAPSELGDDQVDRPSSFDATEPVVRMAALTTVAQDAQPRLSRPAAPPPNPLTEPAVLTLPRFDEPSAAIPQPSPDTMSLPSPGSPLRPVPADQPRRLDAPQVAALPDLRTDSHKMPGLAIADCEADLFARPDIGQSAQLVLSSPCRPGQLVTIRHEGLAFTEVTDGNGQFKIMVPAFAEDAVFEAEFSDKERVTAEVRISGLDRVSRAALVWQGDYDLNLHAFEYGAIEGTEGHVWQGEPRSYPRTRRDGGGYLVRLGNELANGLMAEVYTIQGGRNNPRGVVKLSVGVARVGEICGSDIRYATLRSVQRKTSEVRDVSLALTDCNSDDGRRLFTSGFRDLAVAGR